MATGERYLLGYDYCGVDNCSTKCEGWDSNHDRSKAAL